MNDNNNFVMLECLDLPKDLKRLDYNQCERLCSEIRKILIDTVSKNGGHLASNLGAVELTMAIHRVLLLRMIKLYGMLDIRLTHIKSLPDVWKNFLL